MNIRFFKAFLCAVLVIIFFMSCDSDKNDVNLVLGENTLTIENGTTGVISIVSGNGEYTTKSENRDVATSVIEGDKVVITAAGAGETSISVSDAMHQSVIIKVTVSPIYVLLPESIIHTCPTNPAEPAYKFVFKYDEDLRMVNAYRYVNDSPTPYYEASYNYDAEGRITSFVKKGESINYTYKGDTIYMKNADVSKQGYTFIISDDKGYVQKSGGTNGAFDYRLLESYTYDYNGNMLSEDYETYEYDNKNGIFKNVNAPLWFFYVSDIGYDAHWFVRNNCINNKRPVFGEETKLDIIYSNEGYPDKLVMSYTDAVDVIRIRTIEYVKMIKK